MSGIRARDTTPELAVRQVAHGLGFRFRLHRRDLPGSPDLVFPARRKVIFVHGCYWHRHRGCRLAYEPKSNIDFWNTKFTRNVQRDNRVKEQLESMGWDVLVIWECETHNRSVLTSSLESFLNHVSS